MARWTAALAAVIALLVAGGGARADETVRFAVVIGHNVGGAGTHALTFAEKDARKMAEVFSSLSGVDPANVWLLLAVDADALRAALGEIGGRIKGGAGGRTELLLYYSGHADEKGLQLGATLFPMDELRAFLEGSGADVTVAFLDACESGSIIRDKGGKRVPLLDLPGTAGDTRGFAVITSSAAGEKSQESDELRGSFFTHFLASGMRGDADMGNDGSVTLTELYQYVYNKTLERTAATGAKEQHPTFDYAMSGSGQVVLSFPGGAGSKLVLPAEAEGNFLLYSPERDFVIAEVEKRAGEARVLAVPAGVIELFRRSDVALYRADVTVGPGETVAAPVAEMSEVSRSYLIEKGQGVVWSVAAKGGYQAFWDGTIRQRSLLPSVLGGMELRAAHLVPGVVPFAKLLVGGGVGSGQGGSGPLAQSYSCLEAGLGVAFPLLDEPWLLELSPAVSLYVASRAVEVPGSEEPEDDTYAMAVPSASITFGREILRALSLGVQVKAGYLYFREDGGGRHLGFSEVGLSALLRL